MANYDGSVRINTMLNTSAFNTGISGMTASLKKLAGAIGIAFSAVALVKFGKECIELSSDLTEVDNVVSKSFGNLRSQMDELANESIKTLGMSRLTAYQTGSTFMSMGKAMMDDQQAAADMAIELTKLTGNMSSFYNKSQDLVSTALKSVYTGETETLKQYGIVMTEVNLKQFALEQGITKSYSAMSQAEKVQLRYNYVLAQTAFIGDDFVDTQDSWANQTRILTEQWKEFMTVIGNGLVTVLTPALHLLNNIVSSLITFANTVGSVMTKVFGIQWGSMSSGAEEAADSYEDTASAAEDCADATDDASESADNAVAAFDDVNVLQQDSGSSSDSDTSDSGTSAVDEVESSLEDTDSVLDTINERMASFFEPFKEAWDSTGAYVVSAWKYALTEIQEMGGAIADSFMQVWTNGTGTLFLENILSIVGNIGMTVGNLASQFTVAWNTCGVGTSIMQNIFNILNSVFSMIKNTTKATADWASTLDFYPLLSGINDVLASMQPIIDTLGTTLEWLWENIVLPFTGWVVEDALPAFLETLSGALDVLSAALDVIVPIAESFITGFLEPIAKWTGGIIISVLTTLADKLKDIGDWMSEHSDAIENIAIVITSVATAIGLVEGALKLWTIAQEAWNVVQAIANTNIIPFLGNLAVMIVQEGLGATVTSVLAAAVTALNLPLIAIIAIIAAVVAGVILLIRHFGSWQNVVAAVQQAWEDFRDKFGEIWEDIKNAAEYGINGVIGMLNGLISGFELVVNCVIDGVNAAVDLINDALGGMSDLLANAGFDVNLRVPSFDHVSFSKISDVQLATGGITTGRTLAEIGEAGREAVLPLENNIGWMDDLANMLVSAMGGKGNAEMTIDGKTFGQLIYPYITSEASRIGTNLATN